MNHILCVKWGNKYISEYANVLYNMCKRHTTVPYEFHCVTDDVTGLNPDIHVIKFPKDVSWIKTWWSKLWMFSDALPIKGNVLYFDLDVIIHRNIDALFNYQGKFNIIRDFNRCRIKDWSYCNSSVMRWRTGEMNYLHDDFIQRPHEIMGQNHGDQDWITKRAKQDVTHWPDDWIRSYKWEMIGLKDTKIRKGKKFVFEREPDLSPENRVAVFHGEPKPFNCGDQFVVDNWK